MSFASGKLACPVVEKRVGCVQASLKILGDKWTPLLLGQLVGGKKTFGELESELAGISPRTLSSRLEKLLAEQIVTKQQYCPHPPRYYYELTEKGQALQEVLEKMAAWGDAYYS